MNNKNKIEIFQNRDIGILIAVMDGDEAYNLKSNEKLVFGVKMNPENTEYDIQKELTTANKSSNGYLLTLTADDTNITAGRYKYDVALETENIIETVIPCSDFIVIDSVVRSDEK